MNLGVVARELAGRVLPRGRQWRQLLASCDLDPDQLETPLEAPGEHDFVICGSPRTGTTLLAAMLFQPPTCITVMEPWEGLQTPPAQLFSHLHAEIATGMLASGKLDVEALRTAGTVVWSAEGAVPARVSSHSDTLVGVKWPGFWRYLDLLPDTKFLVCVRDPVAVIASYRKAGGRLAEGLEYDVALHRSMNLELQAATDDPVERQVLLHDYVTARILPHLGRPNVRAIRYERWFSDPEGLLREVGDFLGASLDAPLAQIRSHPPASGLSEDEGRAIRETCTTAEALGYGPTHT